MAEGRLHVGVPEHPRDLPAPRVALDHPDIARREPAACGFGHDQVVIGVGRDLGQVRDHQGLPAPARQCRERLAHASACFSADPLIDFVEDERRHRVVLGQDHLERQHHA